VCARLVTITAGWWAITAGSQRLPTRPTHTFDEAETWRRHCVPLMWCAYRMLRARGVLPRITRRRLRAPPRGKREGGDGV